MKRTEIPMWRGEAKLLLKDVLQQFRVPKDLIWTLYEFDGVTGPNCAMSALELMEQLQAADEGIELSGAEFADFVENLLDINEIHVVGEQPNYRVDISAWDSGTWIVAEAQ